MSGRPHPDDVITALYEVVDDRRLPWLDDLLIDAGLRRRCPCTAMAPADGTCDQCCGGTVDFFEVYRCTPEAVYILEPPVHNDPVITIRIAAAGGGKVGHAYAGNDWIYTVHVGETLCYSGHDLRSGAYAQTHDQMAVVLAESLTGYGLPAALAERLTDWVHDQQYQEGYADV
jgi:hypothetical protein